MELDDRLVKLNVCELLVLLLSWLMMDVGI